MSVERSELGVERSAPKGAVFISYAREDTDAARRIAEALRSHGVEVWFDQNELRGGDAWDAKIRKQINDCTLFLPVISQNTQGRGKGYFRLEWKLAVDQTHLLAEGVPFIAPVVIDDTREAAAIVPPEFMRVQWSRLPGALPTPQFVEQVKRLLSGEPKKAVGRDRRIPPQGATAGSGDPALQMKRGLPRWIWGAGAAVVVLLAAGVVVWRKPEPTTVPAKPATEVKPTASSVALAKEDKSIAVLPFENMSEDKDAAFFADGIHEDILTNLSNIRELHVVSRTSVMQYRATTKSIPQIARELGVAYILEGSVRRDGGKVRVTGQLINARTDEHVWAKAYDRDLTDIFAIQSELAQAIAAALQTALSPQEKSLLEQRPTDSLAAYELVLKAHELRNRPGYDFAGQERLLKSAVQLDPTYATAYADLAYLYAFANFVTGPASADLNKAKDAIDTATRLAPGSPDVVRALGDYYYYGFHDYVRALEQYGKLAQLRPNDPVYYARVAAILRRQNHWTESLAAFRKVEDVEPGNLHNRRDTALLLAGGRRFGEAIEEMRRLVARSPDDLRSRFELAGLPYVATGSTKEMEQFLAGLTPAQLNSSQGLTFRTEWALRRGDLAEAVRLDGLQPPNDDTAIDAAMAFAAQGNTEAARLRLGDFPAKLRALIASGGANSYTWADLGLAEALLGQKEDALRDARKATELMPESLDALVGAAHRSNLALVLAWVGDKDAALAEYARLFRIPFGISGSGGTFPDASIHTMRLDPRYDPLRGDPRFEALLNDPKNNAPLF